MSKSITLKVNKVAKEKLDVLKKKEVFPSFSDAIESMCAFFELNKISPKDGLNQGYQNSIFNVEKTVKMGLFELKKQYNKDSQSMRKLMRALEKDHMIGTSTKVSYLYDKSKEESVNSNVKESFNSIVNSSKEDLEKDKEIEFLKDKIEEKNDEIKRLNYTLNDDNNMVSKYEDILKKIYQIYETDKGLLGGKERIIIPMDKLSFDKLFDIFDTNI